MNHSIRAHIVAPIWLRVPLRVRWAVVDLLNRSRRQCWADLVDVALARREDDACDVRIPGVLGNDSERCASVCDWSHQDHVGEHDCSCYCGKFRFAATDGARERTANRSMPRLTCTCTADLRADTRPAPSVLDPWVDAHAAHDPTLRDRVEGTWR